MIYVVGNCPICGEASPVILARTASTCRYFTFCGACGVAWPEVPGDTVDSLYSVRDFAPDGIQLPTREELRRNNLEHLIVQEFSSQEWWIDLGNYMPPQG